MKSLTRGLCILNDLAPHCPCCGAPPTTNSRVDEAFVQDASRHAASERYTRWLRKHEGPRLMLLELDGGGNTQDIIKYPFRRMAAGNASARYLCINQGETYAPSETRERSLLIGFAAADIISTVVALLNPTTFASVSVSSNLDAATTNSILSGTIMAGFASMFICVVVFNAISALALCFYRES